MANRYETVFIMTPVLSEDQMKEAGDKYLKHLKSIKAEMVFDESWGLRKLAYPIQKKSTGFYHLFEYKMDGIEEPSIAQIDKVKSNFEEAGFKVNIGG